MTNAELLQQIQNKTLSDGLLILVYDKSTFIANQYIKRIAEYKQLTINYIDSLDAFISPFDDIFGQDSVDNTILTVHCTNKLTCANNSLISAKNLIIVAHSIDSACESLYAGSVVKLKNPTEDDIKDYVYSKCQGIPDAWKDRFCDICKYDLYKIDNEISKLSIFDKTTQSDYLQKFLSDAIFSDLCDTTIFNLTDAILKRNIDAIKQYYWDLRPDKNNVVQIISILRENFGNLITVTYNPSCTNSDPRFVSKNPDAKKAAEETKKLQRKLYALKKIQTNFTYQQIIRIYRFLCSLDKEIKLGNFPVDDLSVGYLITKILSM